MTPLREEKEEVFSSLRKRFLNFPTLRSTPSPVAQSMAQKMKYFLTRPIWYCREHLTEKVKIVLFESLQKMWLLRKLETWPARNEAETGCHCRKSLLLRCAAVEVATIEPAVEDAFKDAVENAIDSKGVIKVKKASEFGTNQTKMVIFLLLPNCKVFNQLRITC